MGDVRCQPSLWEVGDTIINAKVRVHKPVVMYSLWI